MPVQSATEDRNFDDLAARFKRNVYGGLKGQIRLAVVQRDFADYLPAGRPLRVLDAGGGQGQFSLGLAQAGHRVVLCDISGAMLGLAAEQVAALGVQERVTLVQCALQDLPGHLPADDPGFDLVLSHAVMEWLAAPAMLLPCLLRHLLPGGYLSLTFYNRNALVFKNLLRTNYEKVLSEDYRAFRGSLTPINPMDPETVYGWLAEQPLERLCTSGIRVFYDYLLEPEARTRAPEQVLALELALSRQEPYRALGRYIHVLARRHAGTAGGV